MSEMFSKAIPDLQTVWDATSLADLQSCAEKYRLKHLEGWSARGSSVHLIFGSLIGNGLERFYQNIIDRSMSHDDALRDALRLVLTQSYGPDGPLLGRYVDVWRCLGAVPFKNEKGNRAKCPWSHSGKFFPAPGPEVCGACGSPTEQLNLWFPDNPVKDRLQLCRVLVWYTEEMKTGGLRPVSLTDGESPHRALVEHFWEYTGPVIDGVQFKLCGWFDSVKSLGDDRAYPTDYKTTQNTPGAGYFSQFNPNVQMNLYDAVAFEVLPAGLKTGGVVVEAIQLLQGGCRFAYKVVRGTESQRAEFMREVATWLAMAKTFAETGNWPRNRSNCRFCEFNNVCSSPESARKAILEQNYERGFWNPLKRQKQETRP